MERIIMVKPKKEMELKGLKQPSGRLVFLVHCTKGRVLGMPFGQRKGALSFFLWFVNQGISWEPSSNSGQRLENQGRVVRKPVNVNPGLNVN